MTAGKKQGVLTSLQVGRPRDYGTVGHPDPQKRAWRTGFAKTPVSTALWLATTNLDGDGQADLEHHGGVDKAVCVYPADHYEYWEELLQRQLEPGAFGENFTVTSMTESSVCLGDIYRVGEAVVEVSQPRSPCWKLARFWGVKDLALKVQQTGRSGWYLRVLEEGRVASGAGFFLESRPFPRWNLREVNNVMYDSKREPQRSSELADCPALGESWRRKLKERVTRGKPEEESARLLGPEELRF